MIRITNDFAPANRNFGNKLFTYAIGRIFSSELDLKLVVPENSHIQRGGIVMDFPYGNIDGRIIDDEYYVSDHSMNELGINTILENCKNRGVFLDGYFLKYEYIKYYKNFIRSIYKDLTYDNDGKNDVVIMLRDSNCDGTFKLNDEYYLNILNSLNFDNLYISYDHFNKHLSLFEKLKKFSPNFIDDNIIEVFKLITSKNTIIACQGTFSFWASFLSNANKIYWPITKIGPNSPSWCVNLSVDDETRYEFITL